jgi:DMSO/TMAO reductase YedYZ molybdopterin-dependent catalytic subunit
MNSPRLPPGQQLAAPGKWPVVGERESAPSPADWRVSATGLVDNPRSWSLDELRELPQETRRVDIHCVTRWSILNAVFTGVPLATLLADVRPTRDAGFVSFVSHSPRGHSTSLPLEDALRLGVFLALTFDGKPIEPGHGGPVRSVTPGRYFYKSLKWLAGIELLAEDRLGFWEASAGYHNRADPWNEERFIASGISKQEAARLFAGRDISGRELLGLDGSDRDLAGLQARGAVLRNTNFQRAQLQGADFSGANLSNACFIDADLRSASLANADVEGANFCGCDLRGADFRGASLFGSSFVDAGHPTAAIFDANTRIDAAAIEALLPQQAEFVRRIFS